MILSAQASQIRNLFLISKCDECIQASEKIEASSEEFNSYQLCQLYKILSLFEISQFEEAQKQFINLIQEARQKKGSLIDQVDLLTLSFYQWELCDYDSYECEQLNEELFKAIEIYKSDHKLEDLNTDGVYHLAQAMYTFIEYFQYDSNFECIEHLKRAQQLLNQKLDQEILFLMGWMLDYLGKNEEAIEYQLKLYSENQYFPSICNNISVTYKQMGKDDKQEEFLLQAEKIQPKNIVVMHNLAINYNQKDNQLKVEEYFTRSLAMYPNNSHTHYMQGHILLMKGEHQLGMEVLQKGIQVNPNDCNIYELMSLFDHSKFQEYMQKCISIRPKKSRYYSLMADRFLSLQQIEQSLNYLNLALSCKQSEADYVKDSIKKVVCYRTLHNYQEALQLIVQTLEKIKTFPNSLWGFQICKIINQLALPSLQKISILDSNNSRYLQKLDEIVRYILEKAKQSYIEGLKINPRFSQGHNNLGVIYQHMNMQEEALQCFLNSLEINPQDYQALMNIGNIYSEKNQLEEAKQWMIKSLNINPKNKDCHLNLGTIYIQMKKYKEAEQSYLRALDLDAQDFLVNYKLGCLYSEVLLINPSDIEAYFNLGQFYSQMNMFKEEKQSYLKILQIDPKYFQAYEKLGNLYFNMNMLEDAKQNYLKSIDLNPQSAISYFNLGITYQSMSMLEEAKQCYLSTLQINPQFSDAKKRYEQCDILLFKNKVK
ncbi:tetratricopeptide repeat protein (macronuclear) [Tetrahymena thermophila SB210]|uniref:Tetratricopeptide repeat protein n=1 Tax=Tetrahymena thermophila (strain SB210) TaxID=312017 RepID=W7X765_TETTS|nr:tetratricopeptide repeat protein [Tetrahymena thermophila SB210]EWS72238.1 tetratricopeptide repeat protein [Tetrahymena thermophila SB210]|eukprot:XP_012655178.1 tetratricopeptide repeat protein [Tetrahymena thermophila SB210]